MALKKTSEKYPKRPDYHPTDATSWQPGSQIPYVNYTGLNSGQPQDGSRWKPLEPEK